MQIRFQKHLGTWLLKLMPKNEHLLSFAHTVVDIKMNLNIVFQSQENIFELCFPGEPYVFQENPIDPPFLAPQIQDNLRPRETGEKLSKCN